MFEPKENRVDYGEILSPPDGFQLHFAVGTTYSLDFDTFIAVCMNLGLSNDIESELLKNKVFMLEALHKTSDKIALFCQGGQIHSPAKAMSLYALIENSVYQVLVKKENNKYASFHPKFWLISYINKNGEKRYRLIVLSRNLTFDRSWDVVVAMDGRKAENLTLDDKKKNEPLQDFLGFLLNNLNQTPKNNDSKNLQAIIDAKKSGIETLISELNCVKFETQDNTVKDFDYIPIGIGQDYIGKTHLFDKKYCELLVMSPFLSSNIVKGFNDRWLGDTWRGKANPKPVLITRRQSLNEVKNCDNFEVYCMRDAVAGGEDGLGEGEVKSQDIHAKLYMLRQNRSKYAELYLGSMNASNNALNGNVEFMLRLACDKLDLDELKKQLFGEKENENPFERITDEVIEKSSEDSQENHDGVIKAICASNLFAEVKQAGDKYEVILNVDGSKINYDKQKYSVTISPLLAQRERALDDSTKTIKFDNLDLEQLSQFYRVTLNVKDENTINRIVVIPTSGIPQNRDEKIISSIVKDVKSFYAYLSFALDDNSSIGAMEALRILQRADKGGSIANERFSAMLYERMLKIAATNPEKLKSLDYLMKAVSKDGVVSDKEEKENLDKLVNMFKVFIKAVE